MAIFSGIGAAVAGLLFTAGTTAFAVASSVIGAGLALGASLLVSYLNRPKKRPYSAVQGQVQFGADVPANTVFGISKIKGHRIFYAKYGRGNKYNAEVFVLANGWCDGLEPEIYFYGEKHALEARALVGGEAAHYGVTGFGGKISIRFYDGRPGQVADAKLVADTAQLGKTWKATSVGEGIAYVVVERLYDEDLFKNGRLEFEFVLRGLRQYDPRKDSTAGGTGPQRLANPATWAHTANPAIHRLNYLLGLKGRLSGRTLIGMGKPITVIDVASHIAAANVCDTVRNGKPLYACSLVVQAEDDHTEILKEFEDAMAGYAMSRNGFAGVIAGAPQIPVLDIGPADIRTDDAQEIAHRKSAFDLYNILSGQFTSKESHWKPESLKTVTVNADISADGRRRQAGNDFLQVTDPDIAQYLLNIRYRQNRKGGSAKLPVSRRVGIKVNVGNWVTYAGKTWLVSGRSFDARLRFSLSLSETGADIYDDDDIEPGPVIVPPAPTLNPSQISTVQNFVVEAGFLTGADGHEVPSLRFTWTPPADPTITAVRLFYFIGSDPAGVTMFEATASDVEAGEYVTSKDIQPGVHYTAHATITTVPDRLKTYTPWVTTATQTAAAQFPWKALAQDIRNTIAEMDRRSTDLHLQLDQVAAAAEQSADTDGWNVQSVRSEVKVSSDRLAARIGLAFFAAINEDDDTAFAAILEEVTATMSAAAAENFTSSASAVRSVQASVKANGEAIAQVEQGVEVIVGNVLASGLIRFTAVAGQGGSVQIAIEARVSTSANFVQTGLYLFAEAGGMTRVIINAAQFMVGDINSGVYPFALIDGVLRLNLANIGTVTAGKLQSPDGKFVIDLANKSLEIWD